jgi:hypothetical protein
MKRSRRRFAVLVATMVALGATVSSPPRPGDAHTCLALKVTKITVLEPQPACVAEATATPSTHLCPNVMTPQVTVIVCVELPNRVRTPVWRGARA